MSHAGALTGEQVGWYEAGLPLIERKKRGHFSTPSFLVEQMLDVCGYSSQADLSRVRVLDPACGSGNFLVGAAQRLAASGKRMQFSQEEQALLIQRNIWGFDPDPISCFLAEMQLSTIMNICPHIHQADSLSLPWEACADLFLANPPYLAAKNNDLSGYRSAQQRGQADSYLLFLALALQVVRPGGWIGLVLPDPVLARFNAARERAQLLKQVTLHHLWHLSGVFAAEVGAVVLIAQNTPPRSMHQVSWVRKRWQSSPLTSEQHVAQAHFLRQPAAELRYLLSNDEVVDRLRAALDDAPEGERRFAPLSEFLSITRGEELGRESQFITPASHPTRYPVLRGGVDIRPYSTPRGSWWIDREAVTKPLRRYLTPKLLVVKSTNRLQAVLDTEGHVALQTLYLLHVHEKGEKWEQQEEADLLYFFLALLNSRLLREYVYVLHTAYKWVQPQIEQRVLADLPVPIVEKELRQPIIEQARELTHVCSRFGSVVEWSADSTRAEPGPALYEELERTIRALYTSALTE